MRYPAADTGRLVMAPETDRTDTASIGQSTMNQEQWTEVDRYIAELFLSHDPALDAVLDASAAAGLPPINVAPNQGKLLLLLARVVGARTILEIGTLGGYSTIWLARALPADGRLITLETDPRHAEIARANIARAGLAHVVELRLGPALETLPRLAAEGRGPFDLIFIDADKPSYPEYLRWAIELSHRGSLIIADNVVRDGAVVDEASGDPRVQGVRRFNALLAGEPRVSATVVQTVGSKGYDGFAIALVTADHESRMMMPHAVVSVTDKENP
jgi:predicted O-methyltransferase YrrM